MHAARDQLLARTRLPEDEHRDVAGGDACHLLEQLDERTVPGDEAELIVSPLHAALQVAVEARTTARPRLLAQRRLDDAFVDHASIDRHQTFARLRELELRTHVLEVIARRTV